MQTLDVGETAITTTTWWDDAQQPVDPTSITVTYTKPDGTIIVRNKADLTGSESMAGSGTDDVWTASEVVDVAGAWRIDVVGFLGTERVEKPSTVFLVGASGVLGGPCEPWCSWDDVARCGTPPDLDSAGRELVLDNATEILYNLSGRKYPGICAVTRSLCFACRTCAPRVCSCDPYPSIDLGGRFPVWDVWDVTLDGVDLPRSSYEVRGRRWLVRTDGAAWPVGLQWSATQPDAFVASWAYGRQPPVGGRLAAARYALEAAKLCVGGTCDLNPQSARNVTREGVTYTVLDADSVIAEGRTGLGSVDAWLVADAIGSKPRPHAVHPALGASRRIV